MTKKAIDLKSVELFLIKNHWKKTEIDSDNKILLFTHDKFPTGIVFRNYSNDELYAYMKSLESLLCDIHQITNKDLYERILLQRDFHSGLNQNSEFNHLLDGDRYKFLFEDRNLGDNVLFLAINSDFYYFRNKNKIKLLGVSIGSQSSILGFEHFDEYLDKNTKSVIYSLKKFIKLLSEGSPIAIEMLGIQDEYILKTSPSYNAILRCSEYFITKDVGIRYEKHIKNLNNELKDLKYKIKRNLQNNKSTKYEKTTVSLIEFEIIKKLLVGIDILDGKGVVLKREKEVPLLCDILSGKYQDENGFPIKAFYEIENQLKEKFMNSLLNTKLPAHVDKHQVEEFMIEIYKNKIK